jgi:ubiquitin-conjugating enzyme E2 M
MIKLFSLKQQKKQEEAASSGKKVTAAQIRLQKDVSEIELPNTMKMDFPNPDDLLHFTLKLSPDEGFYKGGSFQFKFDFKPSYPHDPPKVVCLQKIYHPNIDLEGNVCLNILREDWKPVLNLQSIVVGLQFLFLEPNPDDPLNKEAAQVLRSDRAKFERHVRSSMRGGVVDGVSYDDVTKK